MDQASALPRILAYTLLEEMTNGFSEDRELGRGTYGIVYQGLHVDGEKIAVKVLRPTLGHDDEQFVKEYHNLERLQHQNIVRLVGYCNETRREFVPFEGTRVLSEVTHRALCFEYMENGSLENFLSDESSGHEWHTRYSIMKGICKGLKYLHEELVPPMFHLDLKPANVLLDKNWLPKIADFGLSRLIGENRTYSTACAVGTIGYLPPEYINRHTISNKLDVFSLGVIMVKIMAGPMGYSQIDDMSPEDFVKLVAGNWRRRLHAASVDRLETYCKHVETCTEIALRCVEIDRHKRPTIGEIINELNVTESMSQFNVLRNDPGLSMDQNVPTLKRLGPWGGQSDGTARDIVEKPWRLESITLRTHRDIHSISFIYLDKDGNRSNSGQWGWASDGITEPTINLAPTEVVNELSGTYVNTVVSSLKFVTNLKTYGPYGTVHGTHFKVPVPNDNVVVGFFAVSGKYLDKIGVYTVPSSRQSVPTLKRLGPWGGQSDGTARDIAVKPRRLESITLRTDRDIHSITFRYLDNDGNKHNSGQWGWAPDGRTEPTINLEPTEVVYEVSGTYVNTVVSSLKFVTNLQTYGPYGTVYGTPFKALVPTDNIVVGFFAVSGKYLDKIGVYTI